MTLVRDMGARIGIKRACRELGVSRATYYRRLKPRKVRKRRGGNHRALSEAERQRILAYLVAPGYDDLSAKQVHYRLWDEKGIWLASVRTFYRILRDHRLSGDRRNQRRHPAYEKPVLRATAPNQAWTWDITVLPGATRGAKYYLIVLLDLYSRYVPGWMVVESATAELCQHLILTTMLRRGIEPDRIRLHSDRGPQMKAGSWDQLKADLGLDRSFSRPRVSNDNAFSESQFRTLKYRPPGLPKLTSLTDARGFCQEFFAWYNHKHYHSGIADLTPASVYYGDAAEIVDRRQAVLTAAYERHPERFARPPVVRKVPELVGINHLQEVTFEPAALI